MLTLLFLIQKHGTGMVGKLFAPIMLLWFLTLAVLGVRSIIGNPEVLQALNPYWAVHFFLEFKTLSFIALGAVVLSITGVEALYADMGHFGKLPIRLAWFSVVLPSLVLNYFGQGALLLKHPEAIKNPFFAGAGLGINSIVDPRRAGNGHRLSGGYLRCLLADASGRTSGVFIADAYHPYLGNGIGPDLHSFR